MGKLNLNFYYKNLIIVFMVTCFPLAIIAVSNYFIGIKQIEAEVKRNHQLQLQQVYESMEKQLTHLKVIGNEWVFNPIFNSELLDGDLRLKPNTTREILISLRILKETTPLIDNAVLYLKKDQLLISDEEGIYSIQDQSTRGTFQELLNGQSSLLWWNQPVSPLKYQSKLDVALVHKVQGIDGEPFGAIILFLEKSQMDQLLFSLNPDGSGVAFILKDDGGWVTNGRSPSTTSSELDEEIRREVLEKGLQGADFIYKRKGISYSVTVGAFSRNDWKYVVATPLSQLTSSVILFSKLGLAVSLFGLVVAMILSWLASKSIYKPVKHLVGMITDSAGKSPIPEKRDEFHFIAGSWSTLVHESQQMEAKLEQSRHSLKEGFLLQLIQGHLYFFSENELKEKMAFHGWDADNKGFAIILIRMDGIFETNGKFYEGDEQLATFAAANITQEILQSSWQGAEVINFHDLSLAVVLDYPSDRFKEQVKSDLFRLSDELIQVLTRFSTMRVTVGVGKLVYHAQDLHKSLEEAREALNFRDLDKNEQILDMDNLLPQKTVQVSYPFKTENEIIQSMKMGVEQEAVMGLERFVQELKQSRAKENLFQQGMQQLVGSITHALLKSGVNSSMLFRGGNLYEQLSAIKDPEEMLRWLRSTIIEPYIHELSHSREILSKKIVSKVIETIHAQYPNPISLESCADEHGVTSYNLSKAFKQYMGMNFIDYLTKIRLEKAKELLSTTEMKMNDIAEKVGYQPTYFIRIFKKVEGLTPGSYRDKN